MVKESIEGMRRLQFGMKGSVGNINTKGAALVIGEGYICSGARTSLANGR